MGVFKLFHYAIQSFFTSLMRLWNILDFFAREHNLMEKFEENWKKFGAIMIRNGEKKFNFPKLDIFRVLRLVILNF